MSEGTEKGAIKYLEINYGKEYLKMPEASECLMCLLKFLILARAFVSHEFCGVKKLLIVHLTVIFFFF